MHWPTILTTAHLVMRPWREDDAPALYRYASDPEVGPRAGWAPHQSQDESRQVLHDILMVPDSWAITLRGREGVLADEPVGAIALQHDLTGLPADEAEIGYWIARPWWGHGYMTEAVREVLRHAFLVENLVAVRASYFEGNEGSRRVQEKVGLRPHHHVDSAVDRCGSRTPSTSSASRARSGRSRLQQTQRTQGPLRASSPRPRASSTACRSSRSCAPAARPARTVAALMRHASRTCPSAAGAHPVA